MARYKFYSDPGHGWLAVKRSELAALGIEADITSFSMQSPAGGTVYLEEDMDVSTFIKAKFGDDSATWREFFKNDVETVYTDHAFRGRRYPRYRPA